MTSPLLSIVVAAIVASGIAVTAQPPALDGTAWTLSAVPGLTALPGASIRFDDGRLSGSDGCNSFRAPYAIDDAGIRLTGPLVSTRRACPPALAAQAEAVQAAVAGARRVRLDGGTLVLLDEAGADLATWAAQSQDVTGTVWDVTAYNNGKQAVVSVLTGTTLTLEFGADGRVAGTAGCNQFTGTYTVTGTTVAIAGVATTRKMCVEPEQVMEQEAGYLKALTMGTRARIEGARLELRGADGALAVSATRK